MRVRVPDSIRQYLLSDILLRSLPATSEDCKEQRGEADAAVVGLSGQRCDLRSRRETQLYGEPIAGVQARYRRLGQGDVEQSGMAA